jgi:hypothetical protein
MHDPQRPSAAPVFGNVIRAISVYGYPPNTPEDRRSGERPDQQTSSPAQIGQRRTR